MTETLCPRSFLQHHLTHVNRGTGPNPAFRLLVVDRFPDSAETHSPLSRSPILPVKHPVASTHQWWVSSHWTLFTSVGFVCKSQEPLPHKMSLTDLTTHAGGEKVWSTFLLWLSSLEERLFYTCHTPFRPLSAHFTVGPAMGSVLSLPHSGGYACVPHAQDALSL